MKSILGILIGALLFLSCGREKKESIIEVTKFTLSPNQDMAAFNELDAEVEANFTSKQPGFINRQSMMNEKGEYMVVVYWENTENAKASMDKFMADKSVAEYASMIDGNSMQMARYSTHDKLTAQNSSFVEVMSFNTNEDTDIKHFNKVNKKVEKGFTAKQKGFIQRITGVSEEGEQVVLVYWDNKSNSDAALQPFMENKISKKFMDMMIPATMKMSRSQTLTSLKGKTFKPSKKDQVVALLNSFNTGDQKPISYINPEKYIQHNLSVGDGLEGFGAVMQHAPEGGFKANVVRAFEDGDYVFTHTEYDFFGPKAGFDVFRFEDDLIVEHWDNLLPVQKPNQSGRTQFDGTTELKDLDKTETNKQVVKDFITNVLLNGQMDKVTKYINPKMYKQHNPSVGDGLEGFGEAMKYFAENGLVMEYATLHKVLGEGNFVLAMSEGKFGKGEKTAFYDLFRLENGLIVEHWDVIAPIPAKSDWKNENGKF